MTILDLNVVCTWVKKDRFVSWDLETLVLNFQLIVLVLWTQQDFDGHFKPVGAGTWCLKFYRFVSWAHKIFVPKLVSEIWRKLVFWSLFSMHQCVKLIVVSQTPFKSDLLTPDGWLNE